VTDDDGRNRLEGWCGRAVLRDGAAHIDKAELEGNFAASVARPFNMTWTLHDAGRK